MQLALLSGRTVRAQADRQTTTRATTSTSASVALTKNLLTSAACSYLRRFLPGPHPPFFAWGFTVSLCSILNVQAQAGADSERPGRWGGL
jgi:hypothetical protein